MGFCSELRATTGAHNQFSLVFCPADSVVSWRSGAPCAHALVCHSLCVGQVQISAVIRSAEPLTALLLLTLCWIQPACYHHQRAARRTIGLVIPMHCHALIEHREVAHINAMAENET